MVENWTKERIIEAIQARQALRLPLRSVWRDDPKLCYAAYRFFDSWHDALLAAGVQPTQRKWTKQSVRDAILIRYRAGLSVQGILNEDHALCAAAVRHWGSWHQALLAAGLASKRNTRWTPALVITTIQNRYRQGLPLNGVAQYDRNLLCAAQRYWGTWYKAILAAGITDVPRRRWDRQRIVAALEAVRQQDIPLTSPRVPRALYDAASRYFGGWHEALAATGFVSACPPPQHWTRETVLAKIRTLHGQAASLTAAANSALARAAWRHFGSWRRALRLAGVPTAEDRKKWSRQAVLHELLALQEQGYFEESSWIEDRRLAAAAKRHFGTWRGALILAGILAPHEQRRCRSRWNPRRVIEAIQDRYVRGLPMLADEDKNLASAGARYFGSWRAALAAAGLDVRDKPPPGQRWSPQKVIAEIQRMQERGLRLVNVRTTNSTLAIAARRYFGRWHNALVAAGIAVGNVSPIIRERWSKQRIVQEIRALHQRGDSLHSKSPAIRRLVRAAQCHFGGWRQALVAAAIPAAPKPRCRWNKQRVIDALRAQVREGQMLSRRKHGAALTCAAYRHFGGWHKALASAGIISEKE